MGELYNGDFTSFASVTIMEVNQQLQTIIKTKETQN